MRDDALHAADLVVAGERQRVVDPGVVVEVAEGEGEQRQGVLPGNVLEQRVGELRVDRERRVDEPRRAFDHRAIGALQHHVEGERVLRQSGEGGFVLDQRKGVRAHDQDRHRARVRRQRPRQDIDKAPRLLAGPLR